MNEHAQPEAPHNGTRAITLLRVIIWLLPAIIVPVCLAVFFSIGDIANLNSSLWLLTPILPILAIVYCLGAFDYRLRCQQQRIPYRSRDREGVQWAVTFILFQIFVAPVVATSALLGMCVVQGVTN